jgi:uncharacterized metal-binding protein YceD (DUF177 family)
MSKDTPKLHPVKERIALKEIGEEGYDFTISLNDAERRILEDILEIENLKSFKTKGKITPLRKNRFALKAEIKADFSQISSVSLKAVPKSMCELFKTEFWPESQNDPVVSPEMDLDYADEMIEFYDDNWLEIGQVIYEQFVIALEQFPRAEGEVFEWEGVMDGSEDSKNEDNPFVVLKKLKQ